MLKKRIIPKITFVPKKFGTLDKLVAITTRQFNEHRLVGDPVSQSKVFENTGADQLFLINKERLDIGSNTSLRNLVQLVSREISMPVCFAGGVQSISDADFLFKNGIDKISISTAAINDPSFIKRLAEKYGSQAICVCIDYKYINDQEIGIYSEAGDKETSLDIFNWVDTCQKENVGEIILNSMTLDGQMKGIDKTLLSKLRKVIDVPMILSGGCSTWMDFDTAFNEMDMDGVAASTFFSNTDQNIVELKQKLKLSKTLVRVD